MSNVQRPLQHLLILLVHILRLRRPRNLHRPFPAPNVILAIQFLVARIVADVDVVLQRTILEKSMHIPDVGQVILLLSPQSQVPSPSFLGLDLVSCILAAHVELNARQPHASVPCCYKTPPVAADV